MLANCPHYGLGMGTVTSNCPPEVSSCPPEVPFDPDFALRFLKWREEKRRGAVNRGAAVAAPPPIEEVTERIIAKIEAIERHERRRRGGEPPAQG